MKKNIHSIALLFFLLFLINNSLILARFLASKQGEEEELKLKRVTSTTEASLAERQENDSLNQLMGLEDCPKGDDEECTKRRMVAEAHLDYIYTQDHKP